MSPEAKTIIDEFKKMMPSMLDNMPEDTLLKMTDDHATNTELLFYGFSTAYALQQKKFAITFESMMSELNKLERIKELLNEA